jgi:hypothetical protein
MESQTTSTDGVRGNRSGALIAATAAMLGLGAVCFGLGVVATSPAKWVGAYVLAMLIGVAIGRVSRR